MFKKLVATVLVLSITCNCVYANQFQDVSNQPKNVQELDFGISDPEIKPATGILSSVALVVGIVVGLISIGHSSYDVGKYAGKKMYHEHGISKRDYFNMRTQLEVALIVALGSVIGPLVSLGIYDYYRYEVVEHVI